MNQWEMPARFVRHTDIDLIMLAGRYTLLEQPALHELLPLCQQRGVGVIAVGVFNSGILARTWPPAGSTYNYEPAPEELIDRARRIAELCQQHHTVLPAAALQFPRAHPAVMSVAFGSTSAEQVQRNLQLLRADIPEALWRDLVAAALLDPAAPTPAASDPDQG